MKKSHKTIGKVALLVLGVLVFTGCTANFCTVKDKAHILYVYDPGLAYDENGNVIYDEEGVLQFKNPTVTSAIHKLGDTYDIPSSKFWKAIDDKVYTLAENAWQADSERNPDLDQEGILTTYGYLKFAGLAANKKGEMVDTLWANWDNIILELSQDPDLGDAELPGKDFIAAYKQNLNTYVSANRTCITPVDGEFGPEGEQVFFEGKSWKEAFSINGGFTLIEGLLVYPVAWLAHTFTSGLLNGGVGAGWAQLLAILFVTLIVRTLMMALTFKSTLDQQRMMALQPALTKLQEKYPNSNSNQYEKQRFAQEQMALYKKHKINPFSQILMMIVQFPIFIAVWGALSGSAILTSGSLFGMHLNASISSSLMTFNFSGAWWTALVLFLLMSGSQIVASKLPQWIQKKQAKNVSKLGKNPAADKTNKQMKWMSNFMIIMIIVMGFSLPSGMGLYWFFGAIISMIQTLVTQTVMKRKKKA